MNWETQQLIGTSRDNRFASYLIGITMFGVWTWWALANGGFFGTVMLPGSALLLIVLAMTVILARLPLAARGPQAVAFAALVGLALWTFLSLLWTPAQDLALDYGQRAATYAAAFALGLMLVTSLRQRMILSVAPFLAAGLVVTVVVLIKIWSATDVVTMVDSDGTLDVPFGYRNANAGYFLMVAFGAIALSTRERFGAWARAGLAFFAAVAIALAAISQSRGSLVGLAAGVVVLLAVAPLRGRAALTLVAVAIPTALAFSQLVDPFEAAGDASALSELRDAARFALLSGLGAAVLAAAFAGLTSILERRGALPLPTPRRRLATAVSAVMAVLAVVAAFVALNGPIREGLDNLSEGDTAYSEAGGSRFTYSGGLDRTDFYRVALAQAGDNPVAGGGGGSFRSRYLLEGEADEEPRNAHSVWLETLGELGIVGLLLLLTALGAGVIAALRSRRLGPESAALTTVALTVGGVWLGQASVDWSWYFAGLTAPVFALLGSAAAASALSLQTMSRWVRGALVCGALALAVLAVPTFASERLTLEAAREWRSDLDGAYRVLATAEDLNPFANAPLLVEAEIARQSGDRARALAALERAQAREPEDWRNHYVAATVLRRSDPVRAAAEVEFALALYPRSQELADLKAQLDGAATRTDGSGGGAE